MPLQKQSTNINFALGMDQKTDPLQVKPGKFLSLINRVFNKGGRLEKRNGYATKGQSVVTPTGSFTFSHIPGTVAAGRNIASFSDELLLNDGLNLYSYAVTADNWVYKGRSELCQTSQASIIKNKFNNILPDSALNSTLGINVYAWESWTATPYQITASSPLNSVLNGVQISAVDSTSNQTIFSGFLSSTTTRPKCVSISNKLYVLYFNTNDNKIYAQPVTESGFGMAVALITDINTTTPNYDVLVNNSLIYIAYCGTSTTVKVASFTSALVSSASVSKSSETATNGIGIFPDTSNNVWIAYNNGSATKAFIMDSALSVTVLAPTTVDGSASGVKNVTGVYDTAGSRGIIYYDFPGGPKAGQPTGNGSVNYTISAPFTQPAVGSTVTPTIAGPSGGFAQFNANNSIVFIPGGGYYFISGALVGSGGATLANLGFAGNATAGATVAATRQVISPTDGFQNSQVKYNTLTAAGSAGSAAALMRSTFLAGKAFLVNSVPHVITGFDSNLQSTYFACALYNVNAQVSVPAGICVAKIGESVGGTVPYRSVLPSVNVVSSGVVQFAFSERSIELLRTSNDVSNPTFFLGVSSVEVDFTTDDIETLDLGSNLHIGSGVEQIYDGAVAVEDGFTIYPETVVAAGSGSDGALGVGIYGYRVLYEWVDNIGQIHRSNPSPVLSYTIAAAPAPFTGDTTNGSATIINVSSITGLQVGQTISGTGITAGTYISTIDASTQITLSANATASNSGVTMTPGAATTVTLTIPTLRITEKQNVTIAIYRTLVDESVFFRIDTQYLTFPVSNSISSDTITFTDTIGDHQISGNEQLYTDQEVENIAPPSTLALAEYKNRIILVPNDNPYSFWYSKQVISGSPVEFSDIFQQNMGTIGGAVIGSAKLDDKLILFKENSIFYITGTGPSPGGANNDFTDPQFITSDAGLSDPRSIVVTPVGLMFKSSKGIYLLDRSLQARYIGAAVEDYNAYTVRGAKLIPTKNQVRFILSNGMALVYDYYWTDESGIGQWGTFSNISAVSDTLFQDLHTYVTSAGLVYQETPGLYLDGATGVNTYFMTGWFNLAGLQGFERAYYFYFLAQYISSHTLSVNIYYDYDDSTAHAVPTITPVAGELEQWRVFLAFQKCEAFKIEIQENASSGAGFTMSGINLMVGIKKGYKTINASNSTGATT